MNLVLWLIAVVLVVWGVLTLIGGGIILGLLLIVVGLLIGPGGVSLFSSARLARRRAHRSHACHASLCVLIHDATSTAPTL